MLSKLLKIIKLYQSDLILSVAIVFISLISFNLGKISAVKNFKLPVVTAAPISQTQTKPPATNKTTRSLNSPVVASKNSKDKLYHFSWCFGAYRITSINKITFASAEEAEKAGYTLAGNCHP